MTIRARYITASYAVKKMIDLDLKWLFEWYVWYRYTPIVTLKYWIIIAFSENRNSLPIKNSERLVGKIVEYCCPMTSDHRHPSHLNWIEPTYPNISSYTGRKLKL